MLPSPCDSVEGIGNVVQTFSHGFLAVADEVMDAVEASEKRFIPFVHKCLSFFSIKIN
jgi:hypothetical protein